MQVNVLIVDDEPELAEYTAKYFNMSGVSAEYVLDAESARKFLQENTCSLILLDINLGEDSGFDLCREIRNSLDIPIFFISARSSEDDMLLALGLGGDDYICKPYSLSVLLAKVKATLKRYEAAGEHGHGTESAQDSGTKKSPEAEDASMVSLGSAMIDLRRAVVRKDGVEKQLKAMEYRVLVYMLKNRNRIISKDEFFTKVWETEFVGDVTLNVHIRHLREKIEDDPSNPVYIKTVWGTGFILEDKA